MEIEPNNLMGLKVVLSNEDLLLLRERRRCSRVTRTPDDGSFETSVVRSGEVQEPIAEFDGRNTTIYIPSSTTLPLQVRVTEIGQPPHATTSLLIGRVSVIELTGQVHIGDNVEL